MNWRRPGLIFVAVCMAALSLRLLLPAGWMPAVSPDGFAISLCSGASLPGSPTQPPGDSDQPCSFALALGPLLAGTLLLLPLMMLPRRPAQGAVSLAVMPRRYRPRPPGQGPPFA